MGLRIAVAGKGGSGKTTVSVLLAKVLSGDGARVLLVDLDSDPNLASALGLPSPAPLVRRKDLVAERTGSTGEPGGMFILNPRVADLVGSQAVRCTDRIALLSVGAIENAGEGCYCPQTAFVRSLVQSLALEKEDTVILDLEAGLEAFGRSAVEGLDLLLIVVEPGMRSVETAKRILRMVPPLGIRNTRIVGNKVRPEILEPFRRMLEKEGLAADIVLPHNGRIALRDLEGRSLLSLTDPSIENEIRKMVSGIPV